MRRNGLLFIRMPNVEVILAVSISKTITSILRHFDQDERESEGSRHWEGIKSVLLRRFERDGIQDFSDEVFHKRSLKAGQRQEWSTVKTKMEFYVITSDSRAIWRYSNRARTDGLYKNPPNWTKYIYHRGLSWNFQSILWKTAPKLTLKKNWRSQQQQHCSSCTDVL